MSLNFYRKFHNQSREIFDALNDRSDDSCKLDTRDLQPEIYWEIDKSLVQFDEFELSKTGRKIFKKSLFIRG